MARTTAAKFYADNYRSPLPSAPAAGVVMAREFKFTLAATTPGWSIATGLPLVAPGMDNGLYTGDKIYLTQLAQGNAPGFMLLGGQIAMPDMDTSTGLVFQLGDSTAADRFVTTTLAGSIGQTAGTISSFGTFTVYEAPTGAEGMPAGFVAASVPVTYNPNTYATPATHDDLILTVQTGPTTALVGVAITGFILYTQMGQSIL